MSDKWMTLRTLADVLNWTPLRCRHGRDFCGECIAEDVLASDWLAERDARIRAEALREAADWLRDDMDEPWGMRAANRLDARADRIERGESR